MCYSGFTIKIDLFLSTKDSKMEGVPIKILGRATLSEEQRSLILSLWIFELPLPFSQTNVDKFDANGMLLSKR